MGFTRGSKEHQVSWTSAAPESPNPSLVKIHGEEQDTTYPPPSSCTQGVSRTDRQ